MKRGAVFPLGKNGTVVDDPSNTPLHQTCCKG